MTSRPSTDPVRVAALLPVTRSVQPMLHELAVCLAAPTTALSAADGQLQATGAQGVFHADVRVLSRAEVHVGGREPETLSSGPVGGGGYQFVAVLRQLGDDEPDPTVRLDRWRRVVPGGLSETLRLSSTANRPVTTTASVELGCDFAGIEHVKQGGVGVPAVASITSDGVVWSRGGLRVTVTPSPAGQVTRTRHGVRVTWALALAPGDQADFGWTLEVSDADGVVAAAPSSARWPAPVVTADDRRLAQLVSQSLADLSGLRMVTRDRPEDVFLAAGSPWYLTLFGRDSLWAARMLLPLGTELAAGTLRTLAARQGSREDPRTEEQPGKILHEVRRADRAQAGGVTHLPAQYYGTVDATPLWVVLLYEAWRWGLPAGQVEELLDAAVRALDWVVGTGDEDGFLQYVDRTGRGLANQGWKDSGDSVRFDDGRLATPPIALCEVQGYAHQAAMCGAELLAAFGRPGGARYREWAQRLRERFRDSFWTSVGGRRFPALALDRDHRPVDALSSNIGHLLGTGLLDNAEAARVAALLSGPDMDSGYGLRTMSSATGGYRPLSYHCGSVWPHDTAIVVSAMARQGHGTAVAGLVEGLLAAGAGYAGRLPELWSGDPRGQLLRPVPYPASCRPQAWSAAASVALVQALLGLRPDVPSGRLQLSPIRPSPVGRLRVEGLRIGSAEVTVEIDRYGDVVEVSGTDLTVEV